MGNLLETGLIIKKETVFDKIRKNLFVFIYQKDYQMIQKLEDLIKPKRPKPNSQIIVPKEMGKDITKL